MWKCARCGSMNEGNLCRGCGLPAYEGDPNFRANFGAQANVRSGRAEQPVYRERRRAAPRRRKKSAAAWVLGFLALVLTVLALVQSVKPMYRFQFETDASGLNQTVTGALSYFNVDLQGELEKLNFEGTYSVLDLYREDSDLNQARQTVQEAADMANSAISSLQSMGLGQLGDGLSIQGVNGALRALDMTKDVLLVVAGVVGLLLLLALVLLLFGRTGGAGICTALGALLAGALPIGVCAVLNQTLTKIGDGLEAMGELGITFRASLSLTGEGTVQLLLAAGALVCVIFGWVARALRR